uniref:hypothetical protein n=5 Tax=Pseudomonas viridiflava TaxID=33069 RepID=UPI0019818AB5
QHFHADHPVFSCSKSEQKQLNTWVSFQSAEEPLLGQFSVSGNILGIIGKPKITAMRLADWRGKASAEHLTVVEHADQTRLHLSAPSTYSKTSRPDMKPLHDSDWLVLVTSPLLAMFGHEDQQLQLFGEEFLSSLDTGQAFAVRQYRKQTTGSPKLGAIALDATSIIYVLPSFFETPVLSMRQRYRYQMTEGVKIFLQAELYAEHGKQPLILPQPTPANWKPFTNANRRLPRGDLSDKEPLYWQVEINEHPL